MEEEIKKENDLNENVKSAKKSVLRNKKIMIFVGVFIVLLIAAGVIYTNSNKECNSISCKITGDAVSSVSDSPVVAEFNGGNITAYDLDQGYNLFFFLRGLPQSYSALLPKKTYLNESISEAVLYSEALKNGYKSDEKEVENGLANSLEGSGMTLYEFKQELNNRSIDYNYFIDFYSKQMSIAKFLNETLFKNITVSEQEMKDYYNKNNASFEIPEQVRASHILVNSSAEAEGIIKKLDNGANFSELAKEYSIDSTASIGGDLGYFERGQMVPAFENATFSLKKIGDYTEKPVKTQYGYHVIMLTGIKPAENLTFDEVKDNITMQLFKDKESELLQSYLENLLKKADVKIYEKNINENGSGNTQTQ